MGISLERQLYAFLYAIMTGCVLGVVLDFIRISRVLFGIASYTGQKTKLLHHSFPLIGTIKTTVWSHELSRLKIFLFFIGDLLFFVLSGLVFCVFLYHAASGSFRWFYLFGALIGFSAYYASVGRIVVMCSETINVLLTVIGSYLIWLLSLPFSIAWRVFRLICRIAYLCTIRPIQTASLQRRRIRYTNAVRASLHEAVRIRDFSDYSV